MKALGAKWPYIASALLLFISLCLIITSGLGITPDSISYLEAGKNLLQGHGISIEVAAGEYRALNHFPPLYPIALALSKINLAKEFNLICLAIGCVAFYFTIKRSLGEWAAVLGAGLWVCSPAVLGTHIFAWSEPLFLALLLLAKESFYRRRYFSVFLYSSFALLCRFSALAFICWLVIMLLKRKELRVALALSISAVAPCAIWFATTLLVSSQASRSLAFHPMSVNQALGTLELFPLSIWALVIPIIAWVAVSKVSPQQTNSAGQELLHGESIFIACYLGLLIIWITFLDAGTPVNVRILSPIYPSIICIAFSLLLESTKFFARYLGAAIAILCVFSSLGIANQEFSRTSDNNLMFGSLKWHSSETVNFIRDIKAEQIISNGPELFTIYSAKKAFALPAKFNPSTMLANENWVSALEQSLSMGSKLVYFRKLSFRNYNATESELLSLDFIKVDKLLNDGLVLSHK